MTNVLSWLTAVSCAAVVHCGSGPLPAAAPDKLGDGLVFYMPFEEPGVAYLGSGLGCRFELDERYIEPGRYSAAYRFQPAYQNYLKPHQAAPCADLQGFTAGEGVQLGSAAQGWNDLGSAVAAGSEGILWETAPVEIGKARAPHRATKSFLASVYLRADAQGALIRLELLDAIDDTNWQEPIETANSQVLAKDPDASVTAPVKTTHRYGEARLSADWQRVTASVAVDARRDIQRLSIRLSLVGPAGASISASGLQLEQIDIYPDVANFAADWIPGGEQRASNCLSLPLKWVQFDGQAGAMAVWFRLPAPEGGGARRGELVGVGGGWWRPVWYLGTGNAYLGWPGIFGERPYQVGQSVFNVPFRDDGQGRWHHLAATWQHDVCSLYLDGKQVGTAPYFPAEPDAGYLRLGSNVLSGATGAAIIDEVALWNRTLSSEEITALAAHGDRVSPLAGLVPSWLIEVPKRAVFHRGERAASIPLRALLPEDTRFESASTVRCAGLGLEERVTLSDAKPANISIHPWKASPGIYEVSIQADDDAVAASFRVEIVPTLPNPDFLMRAWGQGASIQKVKAFSFNTAGGHVTRLPELLRSGLWADLRFDARGYHPLEPDRSPVSLESARQVANAAAPYPHIAASMINTEVDIHGIPDAAWFWDWAQAEVGLAQKPETVELSPLRIEAGDDFPPVTPDSDPAYRFVAWLNREGKGWPELNSQLAAVMREAGLHDTLFYTDQPTTIADATGLEMLDYWKYPRIPAGLVEFNRVANIARLAGRQLMLTPGAEVLEVATRSERPESVAVIRNWAEQYRSAHPEPLRLRKEDRAWLHQKLDGDATFLFVVNDRFYPGILQDKYQVNARLATRVGAPHDRAEAQTVVLSLPTPPGYALYDIRNQRELSVASGEVELALPAAEAAVLALLPARIGGLRVVQPRSLGRGQAGTLDVSLVSAGGKPAGHRNVLEVTAAYADGAALDVPRFYRVEQGQVSVPLRAPLDAPTGPLTIRLEEMISGVRETVTVQIEP